MTPSARPSPGSLAETGAGLDFAWAGRLGKAIGVWGMSGSLAWDKEQRTRELRCAIPPSWVFGQHRSRFVDSKTVQASWGFLQG